MQFIKRNMVLGIFILIILVISITIPIFFADYNAVTTRQTEEDQTPNRLQPISHKGEKKIVIITPPVISNDDIEDNPGDDVKDPVVVDLEEPDSNTETPADSNSTDEPADNTNDTEEIPDIELNDESIQQLIDENRENIDDEDLDKGTAIFEKLDSDYLSSLLEDGLTEEEKAEMKGYLKRVLTEEEYQMTLDLFGKYIGLVK